MSSACILLCEYLRERFHYDKLTGQFTFKKCFHRWRVGTRAGHLHHSGYRCININGKMHQEHRLAWIYVHGSIPTEMIDHRDGDKSNNIFSNLRCATREQNTSNALRRCDNKSGVKGVDWHPLCKKWQCRVQSGKVRVVIGYYEKLEEAIKAICSYREEVHQEFTNHGDIYGTI